MKQLEDMILDFAEAHPVWGWILVRLAFVVAIMSTLIFGLVACVLVLAPLILWFDEQGFQMGWWFIAPIPILICWGCCEAVKWIYETFLEDW